MSHYTHTLLNYEVPIRKCCLSVTWILYMLYNNNESFISRTSFCTNLNSENKLV